MKYAISQSIHVQTTESDGATIAATLEPGVVDAKDIDARLLPQLLASGVATKAAEPAPKTKKG